MPIGNSYYLTIILLKIFYLFILEKKIKIYDLEIDLILCLYELNFWYHKSVYKY